VQWGGDNGAVVIALFALVISRLMVQWQQTHCLVHVPSSPPLPLSSPRLCAPGPIATLVPTHLFVPTCAHMLVPVCTYLALFVGLLLPSQVLQTGHWTGVHGHVRQQQ
jgi:hypothetical protein